MPSFDIVSKTDLQEIDNAINSMKREIENRYDFKGSNNSIERKDNIIKILVEDQYKLKAMQDMLKVHITRRSLDVKCLDFKPHEKASGNNFRQNIEIKQGIESDIAKKIVKEIKAQKFKINVSIRADELRVEGKKIDDLQESIRFIKSLDIELPLQFINFRD